MYALKFYLLVLLLLIYYQNGTQNDPVCIDVYIKGSISLKIKSQPVFITLGKK